MEVLKTTIQQEVETFTLATEPIVNYETQALDLKEVKLDQIKIKPYSSVFEANNLDQKLSLSEEAQLFRDCDKYMLDGSLNDFMFNQKGPGIIVDVNEEINGIEKIEDFANTIKNDDLNIKDEEATNDEGLSSSNSASSSKEKNSVKYFKCDQCKYKSNEERLLKLHLMDHKKTLVKFSEYKTIHPHNLFKVRIPKLKSPTESDVYKCDQCNYETIQKDDLKRHMSTHKEKDPLDMYKCDQCNYQTIQKRCFKRHMLKHEQKDLVNMYKCDQCSFQTGQHRNLKRHLLMHILFSK